MAEFVRVQAMTLGQVFSGELRLQLPWFQRAYAWEVEHAGRLLNDLVNAVRSGEQGYWLGLIRLARRDGAPIASLIDGHQRTITLTIIFALLRDLAGDRAPADQHRLDQLIHAKQSTADGPGATPILVPQPSIAAFFERHVQDVGSSLTEPESEIAASNRCVRNVLENRDHLRDLLAGMSDQDRRGLAAFILDRCWVVVTTVDDEDQAWTMLANEEDTGLPFHVSERSKISLISVMPEADQPAASQIWEQWHARLGADAVSELLAHLRTLVLRRRSRGPIERDLIQHFRLDVRGVAFMTDEFQQFAARLHDIKRHKIGTAGETVAIAHRLHCLSWLDNSFWVPPLLRSMATHGTNSKQVGSLVVRLDRLAWMLKISGADPTAQEQRFNRVLREIEASRPLDAIQSLTIERELSRAALNRLRDKNFYLKSCCGLVLRRISAIAGDLHGPVDGVAVTIEHVMPRNPEHGSQWLKDQDKTTIDGLTNRLGNLVLLTHEENLAAGTKDFPVKRPILSATRFKATAATAQARRSWNADTVAQRTEELIATLLADLGVAQ